MGNALSSATGAFFLMILVAITVQNSVFARSFGVSRLISLVDNTVETLVFGILLCVLNTISGVMYYHVNQFWLKSFAYASLLRPLAMVACMTVTFLLILVITVKMVHYKYLTSAVTALPAATFNCIVVGTLLLSTTSQLSLANTIAYGLGSSAGFVLAVLLVTEGQRKMQNADIPGAFRGLPATLLYIAGLALAVYGLSGHGYVI